MFKTMTVAKRVALAVSVSAVVLVVIVGFGAKQTQSLAEHLTDVVDVRYPGTLLLIQMNDSINSVSRGINGDFITEVASNAKEWDPGSQMINGSFSKLDELRKQWESLGHTPQELSEWKALQDLLGAWIQAAHATHEANRAWHELLLAGKQEAPETTAARVHAIELWRASRIAYVALAKPLADMVHANEARVLEQKNATVDAAGAAVVVFVVAGLLGLAALGLTVWVIARNIRRTIKGLVGESDRLTEAVAQGALRMRAEVDAVSTEFRPVLEALNGTMDAFTRPIEVTATYLSRISKGDIPPKITDDYQGDFGRIKEALNGCIDALSTLLGEIGRMSTAQLEGDVEAFVDERQFEGAFQKVAAGVNANTRMHVKNILEALEVLAKYGEGDFTPVMRPFPGKQAALNQTFDAIRSSLMAVATEVQGLGRAAVEGKLSVRADASRFKGDWRGVVQGVNDAIDAIVTPFRLLADYCGRISRGDIPPRRMNKVNGDIVEMQANLNRCIDALAALVADVNGLVQAAGDGRLDARVDISKHEGAFRTALDGVNRTLEATIAPVNEAAQVLARLAGRDLRARVEGDYRGDHARIKDAVNTTASALHDALAQVSQAVDQVSSASTQIASSSQAVASGASEQAASLEETTTSLESVSDTTRQTSESAQQADRLARSARAAASDGSAAVEQMQGAMSRIKASAEGTSQIIRDINDIAFQTNLLALNAAVEAARAGEAGRGFAVVAEEVRSLALRAKEAASKTEELIKQSVKEAGQGEITAGQVASKLSEITSGVSKVTEVVAEIATAAREQAAGVQQVTIALGEMDKVTQQNAASAEESSSAASELSGQAEELAAMVAAFQLANVASRSGSHGRRLPSSGTPGGSTSRSQALARGTGAGLNPARPGGRGAKTPSSKEDAFPLDPPGEVSDF